MRSILALVVVLMISGGAGGEPASAPDKARLAAGLLLHGTDTEFAGSRTDLARWSAPELLAVIDAVRARRFGAGAGLDPLETAAEPMKTDESEAAVAEGTLLAAALATPGSWRARVRAWPLRLQERFAARWLAAVAPPPEGVVREVTAPYAQMLLRACGQGSPLRAEPWAPLVLADGQSGRWGTGGAFRYVQDFELSGSMVMDQFANVVGSLREGLQVGLLARRTERGVALEVDAHWSEVLRPINTFDTTLAYWPGGKVTIQLPELRVTSLREVVPLPQDGWVIAVTGRPFPEGDGPGTERRLVLLHVEVLAR